ncbi:HET domain-containing protein [Colletotrichum salicis]|uniref:HET domain-containing protein n=1 Tax=Colletotrichum salicis TaxID=1209931 RepID=A0A135V0D7_9PEZI|nr:HET domain-containing protein [Colletotrichum salicis]
MTSCGILLSSNSTTLCNQCLGIGFDDAKGDARDAGHWERKDRYPDLPIFRKSAAAGCTFCEYLCFVLEEKLPKSLRIALQTSAAKDVVAKLSSPAYVMRSDIIDVTRDWMPDDYGIEQDGIYWLDFRFESDAWRDGPWSDGWKVRAIAYQGDDEHVANTLGIELKLPISDALDSSCIKRLKDWVWGCASNHSGCYYSSEPRSLPTRLIKVGKIDDDMARLVISDGLASTTSYIALSYCWGPSSVSKPQLITTAATLADRQTKIPLREMPDTIRDSVVFARHMGTEYIWIDALCIIQDDAEDWAKEAALIFAVYRHATLTVVAAAGDTSHSGFLQRSRAGPSVLVPFQSNKKEAKVSGTRKLTVSNDKFSALSGLARTFSSALGDEYVAGFWKNDLVRGMLWQTVMQPSTPKGWRAPSWSWASSDAEIGWDLRFSLPLIQQCSIEDIQIEAAGSDSFGRLQSAWIILCAVCVPVILRPVQQAESDQDTHLAEVLFHEGGKVMAHGSLDAVAPSGLRNDDTFRRADFSQAAEISDVSAVVLALRCITLSLDEQSGERNFSSPSFPTGLLVTSSPEQRESADSLPIYQRLGTFRTETKEQADEWLTLSQSRLKLI